MGFIRLANMCYLFAFSGFHQVLASVKSTKQCQSFDLEAFSLGSEAGREAFAGTSNLILLIQLV